MDDKAIIKHHYNSMANKSVEERKKTKNIRIREANNFVKLCLILKYVRERDSVLDIGVGKGGDFHKYRQAMIKELYGLDIANRSILDAIERAREGEFPFKITLKTRDALSREFTLNRAFQVVSSQFCFHYAFADERTLDTAIRNIDSHLQYDGHFIFTTLDRDEILRRRLAGALSNRYYKIEFKLDDNEENGASPYGQAYYYTLVDSVSSCIEYLVDIPTLQKKFADYGFVLVEKTSFREFRETESARTPQLQKKSDSISMSAEEEAVFDLHIVVAFRKCRYVDT